MVSTVSVYSLNTMTFFSGCWACRALSQPSRVSSLASGPEPQAATSCPSWSSRSVSDRKSTRLNSSHANISYAVFCLKKKFADCTGHFNNLQISIYPIEDVQNVQIIYHQPRKRLVQKQERYITRNIHIFILFIKHQRNLHYSPAEPMEI